MKTISNIREMTALIARWKREGARIGLVPTMGWFHEGHLSLMRLTRKKADKLIVSLFVNPMQFGPSEDLDSYPRDEERDRKLAAGVGADILFSPPVEDMYPIGYQTAVSVKKLSLGLCGASRPDHFDGVSTVVAKLFNIIRPDLACFGEKDYQQLAIIRRMVRDLQYPVDIIAHPIVREEDGLAMSSRNSYLDHTERRHARCLHAAILHARKRVREGELSSDALVCEVEEIIHAAPGCVVDYVAVFDKDSLLPLENAEGNAMLALAVRVNDRVRLIDNAPLYEE